MEKVHLPQIVEHQYADSVIYVKYKQNKKEPTELVTFLFTKKEVNKRNIPYENYVRFGNDAYKRAQAIRCLWSSTFYSESTFWGFKDGINQLNSIKDMMRITWKHIEYPVSVLKITPDETGALCGSWDKLKLE